jgi:hypothetical protein
MVKAGSIMLRQHRFLVSTNLSGFYASNSFVKIWIKILDLDYDMRGYHGLVAVTQPFSTLLDLDFNIRIRTDLRWARVLIEITDISLLPSFLWFEVHRPNGWISFVKIRYELDTSSSSLGTMPVPVAGTHPLQPIPPLVMPNATSITSSGAIQDKTFWASNSQRHLPPLGTSGAGTVQPRPIPLPSFGFSADPASVPPIGTFPTLAPIPSASLRPSLPADKPPHPPSANIPDSHMPVPSPVLRPQAKV